MRGNWGRVHIQIFVPALPICSLLEIYNSLRIGVGTFHQSFTDTFGHEFDIVYVTLNVIVVLFHK